METERTDTGDLSAIEEPRRKDLEIAEQIAPGWERQSAFVERASSPVREWMIRELAPATGATVLELAAGTGETGFEVATMVGDAGHLISSDFSPAMLEGTRRRGESLGVENVEFRLIDAERNPLGTDSVDAVICRYGYMLMGDPAAALAETRRVLRPDGRVVLAVWSSPERNPFFTNTMMTLVQRGHLEPPQAEGPGIFSMATRDRIQTLLEDAGFNPIRIEEVPILFEFEDIEQVITFATDTAGPIALVLRGLSENERLSVRGGLEEALVPFRDGQTYPIPGAVLVALAE